MKHMHQLPARGLKRQANTDRIFGGLVNPFARTGDRQCQSCPSATLGGKCCVLQSEAASHSQVEN
jgi:hypothetical protein